MNVDVFLSRKSQDSHMTRQLMDFLVSKELLVFDSDELPKYGNSDYRKAIDHALDVATHMIVVGSSVKYITSPWVEAEWGFYIGEKRAGRKAGNLITVIDRSIRIQDLPPSLRYYEVITFDSVNFEKIYKYVSFGKVSVPQPSSPHPILEKPKPTPEEVELWQQEGEKQYNSSDYESAVSYFLKAAEEGHAPAQNWLGYCYQYGRGVELNYSEALKWFRKAADQGLASAQINIGYAYDRGQGVEQNYTQALKWYRMAADQDYAPAQNNIGGLYHYGRGVEQNYVEALKWYRKAADQGYATAQTNVGFVYALGQGVEQDYAEALKWYRKAADQNLAEAQSDIGYAYQHGQGVEQNYAEALKWYRKAADQGNATAQNNIGYAYQYGQGVGKDAEQAKRWYELAIKNGSTTAKDNLEILLNSGGLISWLFG